MLPAARVLRAPGAGQMFAAGALGRMAIGLAPLGVTFLVVGQTGSYALAGAVGATSTMSGALAARYTARLVDLRGQSRMIPRLLAGHLLASVGLLGSVLLGAPKPVWFLLAGLAGALVVNLGAMTRTRWARIVTDAPSLSAAYSLESMADEVAFMIGPPLATLLAFWIAPAVPVLVGMLLMATGSLLLAGQRATEPPSATPISSERSGVRLFAIPGMSALFVLMLLMGVVFGTNSLTTVAFAASIGRPDLTGLLLAVFPSAALVGGAVLSVVPRRWSLTTQIRLALVTLAVALVPLAVITDPVIFAICAFLIGLSVPAIMVGSFSLVAAVVPRARLTEALSLSGAGITVGIALSSTLAGLIIDAHGPAWAFPISAISALLGLVWFASRASSVRVAEDAADRTSAALWLASESDRVARPTAA